MPIITQEILNYHRIFQKNELTEEERLEVGQVLGYLRSELPVEKLYLYGSVVYGRPTQRSDFDFLVVLDIDNQTLDEVTEKYHLLDLKLSRLVHVTPTFLYGFDRRASQPTEMEFYIHNYGKLLYDSGKQFKVKPKTYTTYAVINNRYKFLMSNVSLCEDQTILDTTFTMLLELYTVKNAHMPLSLKLEEYIAFVHLFSDDEANRYINRYSQLRSQRNMKDMVLLCRDFDKFVYSIPKKPNKIEL